VQTFDLYYHSAEHTDSLASCHGTTPSNNTTTQSRAGQTHSPSRSLRAHPRRLTLGVMPRAARGSAATDRPRQGKCRVTAPLTGCAERPLLKEELPCAGFCASPRCSLLRGLRQALAWRRRAATLVIVHWTCDSSSEDWKDADASSESRLFAYSVTPVLRCDRLSRNGRKHVAAAWASWVPMQEDASPT